MICTTPSSRRRAFEEFLTLHPHSPHAAEVRAALDKLNAADAPAKPAPQPVAAKDAAGRVPPKTVAADKSVPATDTRPGSPGEVPAVRAGVPQVSRIRTWNADTYTRIVIDVGSQVKYQAARISGPDRIYFDIEGAKISSDLLHKPIDVVDGGFLKTVRVAQNQSGVVRVVLEVIASRTIPYSCCPDPYRLVVDVYGTSDAAERAALATAPPPGPTTDAPPAKPEKPVKGATAAALPKIADKTPAKPVPVPPAIAESAPTETKAAPSTGSAQGAADISEELRQEFNKNSRRRLLRTLPPKQLWQREMTPTPSGLP